MDMPKTTVACCQENVETIWSASNICPYQLLTNTYTAGIVSWLELILLADSSKLSVSDLSAKKDIVSCF